MKISDYIKSLKVEKVKTDLLRILFLFIITFVAIMVSLLLLEATFYFTPKVKKLTILSISGLVFLKIIFIVAFLLLVNKEYFDKYSGWSLARIIGKSIFPDNQDTALNAFQIEKAENFLSDIGFSNFRVRMHGDLAKIEVSEIDFAKFSSYKVREKIVNNFKNFGFKFVSLDLMFFNSGNLSRAQFDE